MNRQKKIKQIQKKRAKQASAKRNPNKKTAYVSKADRALLDNTKDTVETPQSTEK